MMEQHGFYSQPIIYHKKDNGTWDFETPFVALSYNIGQFIKNGLTKKPQTKDFITAQSWRGRL